jgi:glycosyltransferase involved in cell wall biosynthesis
MNDERRRVLMLAYYFPPLGGGGVQRTLKFVRYLEPLGWDATVVSTRSRVYGILDPSLLAEIPASTHVIRTRALPVLRLLGIAFYKFRLMRLRTWVTWPDGGLGWAPFAFLAALRAVRRERPDVLFSTSAPFGAHLAAMLVARLTGVPWVADFRDEWSNNPHLTDQPRPLATLAQRAEGAITRGARGVVVAADYFDLAGLPATDARRVEIVNGVDEGDFPDAPEAASGTSRFVLAHVGTIYGLQDPSVAVRALARLVARGKIDGDRVEVRLVGAVLIPGFVPPSGVRVTRTGYVEHARAVAEMREASVLLLYVAASSLAPTGKLYEYLASGRPVLCLTHPDNAAGRIVREWEAGVTADPRDEAAIENALLVLWRRWLEDGLPAQDRVRESALEGYSRRATAAKLAGVLEEARGG